MGFREQEGLEDDNTLVLPWLFTVAPIVVGVAPVAFIVFVLLPDPVATHAVGSTCSLVLGMLAWYYLIDHVRGVVTTVQVRTQLGNRTEET